MARDHRHVVEENRDTMTARAISTPQRHFSQIIWLHVVAHPAGLASSGFPLGFAPGLMTGSRLPADDESAFGTNDPADGVEVSVRVLGRRSGCCC